MKRFETLKELRLERQRLYLKKEMLEDEIKQDFEDFRESLRPVNLIKDLFHKNDSDDHKNGLSPGVLSIGSTLLDLVLSKTVFNKSSILQKFLSSYLIRATGPSMLNKIAPVIGEFIKSKFENFMKKKHEKSSYEQVSASDFY